MYYHFISLHYTHFETIFHCDTIIFLIFCKHPDYYYIDYFSLKTLLLSHLLFFAINVAIIANITLLLELFSLQIKIPITLFEDFYFTFFFIYYYCYYNTVICIILISNYS
jgi:hypothetical protein